MTFLTIFSAPKPFTNPHINIIQRNAIQSWQQLSSDVDVILVGEEPGLAEAAETFGVRYFPNVERNEWGTPLVSSIFKLARDASDSPYLAYVNADILLFQDFVKVTHQVAAQTERFLAVGQRWDLDITQPIIFEGNWDSRLKEQTLTQGELHRPAGSDYFIYPRSLFVDMPDFAIGRAGWDNWMIYKALRNHWQVIDATSSLMIVHQNHDYSHLPGGVPHYDLEETRINAALGGGQANMFMTLDTNYELVNGKVRRSRWSRDRLLRRLERWFRPADDDDRSVRYKIARIFRRLRRGLV
ncbi:MAG: hypothetical protein MUO62_13910 [Anaerolineales bacterium]|nr:hypothetical protein [Anaerolineales bacterium]